MLDSIRSVACNTMKGAVGGAITGSVVIGGGGGIPLCMYATLQEQFLNGPSLHSAPNSGPSMGQCYAFAALTGALIGGAIGGTVGAVYGIAGVLYQNCPYQITRVDNN